MRKERLVLTGCCCVVCYLVREGRGVVCSRIKFVNLLAKTAVSKSPLQLLREDSPYYSYPSFRLRSEQNSVTLPFLYSHNEKVKHQSD